MKYFWEKTNGLKKDIERHCSKEKELTSKLNELSEIKNPTNMDLVYFNSFFNLLRTLRDSKVEVVSKLGKK